MHSEATAAYMADGYARATGKPGICMAQVIGALNLAAGLRDAWLAHSPVIAFTGGRDPKTKFRQVYQEVDDVPAFDLLTTMSKFLCLGLSLADTVRAATEAPAKALRRSDLGTLRPGSAGDASVLELETGEFDYVDSTGERLTGQTRLSARGVVMNGKSSES